MGLLSLGGYEIGRYENGEFVEYVKYYLTETKALDGYVLSDDVTEVVFEYVDGATAVIEHVVEVSNVRKVTEKELPKTGDRWGWWWILGGGILGTIGALLFKMKLEYRN